jgi:hypothetical protein
VAKRLVRISIPADADRQRNPFADDPETWRAAREHYFDHCTNSGTSRSARFQNAKKSSYA